MTNSSNQTETKPKLALLRCAVIDRPDFIAFHLHEHIKCLSQFFDVVLVAEDRCDYKKICEVHKPDIAIFESGVYSNGRQRRIIRNTDAYPEIPKLGFCNSDAYCETREQFLADVYQWGVNTFFTTSVSMGEYTPEIAGQLFVWPNFADSSVFKDYGERKLIPVLFTGSLAPHYPWRNEVYQRVSQCFPSFQCPHAGWISREATSRMLFGEPYARLLNAAMCVPACGTIANELVRKHFEIAGSRSCLVAPRTAALEAAGFIDQENCVFAEPEEILDKLDHLFTHTPELERITAAGYHLVHSRHTLKHRNEIYQWFTLHKRLAPDQKVIQPGPFQPLITVHRDSGIVNGHIAVKGLDRAWLKEADEHLFAGRYAEAEALLFKCLAYHSMPEPKLRLVLTKLFEGDSEAARRSCVLQLENTLKDFSSPPDPVEWAYLVLTALCQGRQHEAQRYAAAFEQLRHPELDRVRFIVAAAAGRSVSCGTSQIHNRITYSVHTLPNRELDRWISDTCRMLKACGQGQLIERITQAAKQASPSRCGDYPDTTIVKSSWGTFNYSLRISVRGLFRTSVSPVLRCSRTIGRAVLHRLEMRLGYFLPYGKSIARSDRLLSKVEELSRDGGITDVMIIGARPGNYLTEACLLGVQRNPNMPTVVCLGQPKERCRRSAKSRGEGQVHWHRGPMIVATDQNEKIGRSRLIIVDGSELGPEQWDLSPSLRAKILVLDDLNSPQMYAIYEAATQNGDYVVIDHDRGCGNGYAIFRSHVRRGVRAAETLPRCKSSDSGDLHALRN